MIKLVGSVNRDVRPPRVMSTDAAPRTIIGVPGRWQSRGDILKCFLEYCPEYLFSSALMMHKDTKTRFDVDVYDRDDSLAEAFSVAGGDRYSSERIQAIAEHTCCVYLIGEGGSPKSARRIMDAGRALLDCGGLGVKIESAGTAHTPEGWRHLCNDGRLGSLLKAFVTYVGNAGEYYSCGMHNLGHPDCVVEARIPAADAAEVIHVFLGYLLVDNPTINTGETFSLDADAPHYRLSKEDCSMFDVDDPFHNPYGIWKLEPI